MAARLRGRLWGRPVTAHMSAGDVRVRVLRGPDIFPAVVRTRIRTCPRVHPGPRPDTSSDATPDATPDARPDTSDGHVRVSQARPHPVSGDSHPVQVNASLSESGCVRPDAVRDAVRRRLRMRRSGVRIEVDSTGRIEVDRIEVGRSAGRAARPRTRRFADGAEVGSINTSVNTGGVDRSGTGVA